jgi:exportin-1
MSLSIEDLDATVRAFYEGRGEQQKQAQATLNQFKENPDAWLLVDKILSDAQYPQTKYLGLQVLDNVIMTRWKVLPRDQCQGLLQKTRCSIAANSVRYPKLHRKLDHLAVQQRR